MMHANTSTPEQDAILLRQAFRRLATALVTAAGTMPGLFADLLTCFRRTAAANPSEAYRIVRDELHRRMDAEFDAMAEEQDWTFIERQTRRRLILPALKDSADYYLKRLLDEVA